LHYLELTLPTLVENLALDEALLLSAEAGGPEALRIWEWPAPAVVLGAACRLGDDVHEAACREDHVPIARRSSGGGTVLLGPGCLLFSLVLRYERAPELAEIRPSYRYILERVRQTFPDLADLQHAGISDLALANRKVSGNAQQRKRSHLLHHGTLLYAFDIPTTARYLKLPARQPEYREGRPHHDFLANMPLPRGQIVQALRHTWQADIELPQPPLELAHRLVDEKYSQEQWVRRR
jgi:lipoate-protein ligase A